MTSAEQIAAFPAELAWWRQNLTRYSADQLATGASDDEWSIGQVYAHLAQSALRFHLPAAQRALTSADPAGEPADFARPIIAGELMPPVKVPASPQYTPQQPTSAADLAALLDEVAATYVDLAAQVAAAPETAGTSGHFRLGHLTAPQWLALVTTHFRGHRRQLAKLHAREGLAAV